MQPENQTNFLIKHWKFVFAILILLLGLYVFSSYGFIEVNVDGGVNPKSLKATLTGRTGSKTSDIDLSSGVIKKFVRRGNYQLMVNQAGKSTLAIVNSPGWFKSSSTNIKLASTWGGQLVGDSPGACMTFTGSDLYSFDCGEGSSFNYHVPASTSQSTYNKPIDLGVGKIEGLTRIGNDLLVLAQAQGDDSAGGNGHFLYLVSQNQKITSKKNINDFSANESLSIVQYKNGFIVYNNDFSKVHYFATFSAQPETLKMLGPNDNSQLPLTLNANNKGVLAEYSSKAGAQVNSTGKGLGKAKVTIVYSTGGSAQSFKFSRQFQSISSCGNQKICLYDNYAHEMLVYSVDSEPHYLYSVYNIDSMYGSSTQPILVIGRSVIKFDADSKTGNLIFTGSEDNNICGIEESESLTVLCISSGNKTFALYLSSSFVNDSVVNILNQLLNMPEINFASIYKNLVYISPNLGEPIYLNSIGGFGYDPRNIKQVGGALKNKFKELNLDSYKITINGIP